VHCPLSTVHCPLSTVPQSHTARIGRRFSGAGTNTPMNWFDLLISSGSSKNRQSSARSLSLAYVGHLFDAAATLGRSASSNPACPSFHTTCPSHASGFPWISSVLLFAPA